MAGTITTNPKYRTYARGEGTTTNPKYPTYARGTSTSTGTATTTPKYYNPETQQVSSSPGVIIEAPTQVLRDDQGNPILNPKGETTSITEVREETIKAKALEGAKLTETQKATLINAQIINQQNNKQQVEIAIDYQAVNQLNQQFAAAGYKNAGELITGIKSGETKILGNKYPLIITSKTSTTTGQKISEEDKKELEKENLGLKQYFIRTAKEGTKEFSEGAKFRFQPSGMEGITKVNSAPDFRLTSGGGKILYGTIGAGITSAFESAIYVLTTRKKTPLTIGNTKYDFQSYSEENYNIEKLKTEKEIYQQAKGAEQLSFIGLFANPKISATSSAKMFELKLKESSKGLTAYEEYLLNYEKARVNKAPLFEATEGTQTSPNIYKGYATDPFGLISVEKLNTKYSVIIKSTPEGKPVITIIERTPAELQQQLKVSEGNIVIGRYGTEAKIPTKSFDIQSVYSPGELPTQREIAEVFGKKYQASFGSKTNVITKEQVFKVFEMEKNLKEFQKENVATTQTKLIKETPLPTEYESLTIGEKVFSYDKSKGKFIYLGKKGQTSLSFGESITIYEEKGLTPGGYLKGTSPGGELTSGKTPPPTGIKPGEEFIPIAISPFFPGGEKPISDFNLKGFSFTENNTTIFNANIPTGIIKPNPKTEVNPTYDIYPTSKTGTSNTTTPIISTSTAQTQIQEQNIIQETIQDTTPINEIITRSTSTTRRNIYENLKQKETTTTPPTPKLKLPRLKSITEEQGYNVYIKSRGTFIKANTAELNKGDAINFGALKVENTTAASFKIIKSNRPATTKYSGSGNLNNFYNKNGVFIEKRSSRINTPGELRGITFKGISIKKNKPKKRGGLKWIF